MQIEIPLSKLAGKTQLNQACEKCFVNSKELYKGEVVIFITMVAQVSDSTHPTHPERVLKGTGFIREMSQTE